MTVIRSSRTSDRSFIFALLALVAFLFFWFVSGDWWL